MDHVGPPPFALTCLKPKKGDHVVIHNPCTRLGKKLLLLVIVTLLSVGVSACGPKQDDTSASGKGGSKAGQTGNNGQGQTPGGG